MNFSAIVAAITKAIGNACGTALHGTLEAFHQLIMAAPMILDPGSVRGNAPMVSNSEFIKDQIQDFDNALKADQNEWGTYDNPLENTMFNMIHRANDAFIESLDKLMADGKLTKKEFAETFQANLNDRIKSSLSDKDAREVAHFIADSNVDFNDQLKKIENKLNSKMQESIKNDQVRGLYSDVVATFTGDFRSAMDPFFGPDGSVKSVKEDWEDYTYEEMGNIQGEAINMNKDRDAKARMQEASKDDDDISLGL